VSKLQINDLNFDTLQGLIPVVTVDHKTKEVLMLAFATQQAIEMTAKTGYAHYWSRSRNKLWMKGETSGNKQSIVKMKVDCDNDAVLYEVKQTGPACHTGKMSCFHRELKRE
jgi:phosphoribosyl-AMP cyclohydrolase